METDRKGIAAHKRRDRTTRINDRVYSVGNMIVSFYLYCDGQQTIAFDAGNSPPQARRGLARLGLDPLNVGHVFLTHSDRDHVGGVACFSAALLAVAPLPPSARIPGVDWLFAARLAIWSGSPARLRGCIGDVSCGSAVRN